MDGKEKCKRKEGDDDEIDETDGDGRNSLWRAERTQIVLREANGRIERLGHPLEVGARDAGVRKNLAVPHLAELGSDLGLKNV